MVVQQGPANNKFKFASPTSRNLFDIAFDHVFMPITSAIDVLIMISVCELENY